MKANSPLRLLAALGLSALVLLIPSTAIANSVMKTDPIRGSNISISPSAITITTATPLSDMGSTITVLSPNGDQVDDGSLATTGMSAVLGMKPLTITGVYTVSYTLLTDNEDPLVGSFTFFFNAPGSITQPTPSPSASAPANTGVTNGGLGSYTFVIILDVLAAMVFMFLVWYAKQTFGIGSRSRKKPRK